MSHKSTPNAKPVGFKDRLKNLLHLQRESSDGDYSSARGGRGSILLTPSILRSIGPESDVLVRLKNLRDFQNVISTKRLEDGAVETIWLHIQDLITLDRNDDGLSRRATLDFVVALCRSQYAKLNLCRHAFFKVLQNCSKSDDLNLNFQFLQALTNDGQCVDDFEEDVGDLITVYIERIGLTSNQTQYRETTKTFLDIMKTLLKLHAVFFSEEHLKCIIQYVCVFACQTNIDKDILMCLNVLDVILCYAYWPKSTVLIVVTTLCKLVNNVKVCQDIWRTTRNLLGSHCGHSAIYTMCGLLQAAETYPDHSVLRGAVFFIGMSLWGAQKVENLRHTPCSILPSLLQSLQCNSAMVTFEVLVTCQRLVQKYGRELQIITWDSIIQILERVYYGIASSASSTAAKTTKSKDLIKINPLFNEILTTIELYYENNVFNGSPEQLYALIERCAKDRPDFSVFKLLSYRLQSISPTKSNWLNQLKNLSDVYYKNETRTTIRIRTIEILARMYDENHDLYGDDFVDVVLLPIFNNFDADVDVQTQSATIAVLVDVCKYSTKNTFQEILDLFEKFLVVRLENEGGRENFSSSNYFENVHAALTGLIDVVKYKWNCDPASDCLQIVKLFVDHLTLQYENNFSGVTGGQCRSTILRFFLSIRADRPTGRLIYAPTADEQIFSYYIFSEDMSSSSSSDETSLVTTYSSSDAFKLLASAFANERYWPCVHEMSLLLPGFLLNRTFVLSDVVDLETNLNSLCASLINICNDPLRSTKMQSAPDKLSQLDLNEFVYPSLCALVPYRVYFTNALQQKLASTIQGAVVSQKSVFVIVATTICILEMPDMMKTMIKDLIKRMSELPSTPTLAIPTLEFLSTLMRMPNLIGDFTSKHYEYVFSIMTPYTNPFRFTELIVAMAFQVIFRFFLRLPLSFRPPIAKYIVKYVGATSSMSRPSSGVEMPTTSTMNVAVDEDNKNSLHSKLNALNSLARQVLLTFLAHYSFRNDLPRYRRSKVAKLLFDKRKTKHWIVGDRIVGVTVSDYDDVDESGLCADCRRVLERPKTSSDVDDQNGTIVRRRYKSAVQRRVTQPIGGVVQQSMDDSWISSGAQNAALPSRKTSLGVTPTTTTFHQFSPFRSPPLDPVAEVSSATLLKTVPSSCTCWCRGFVEISVRHAFGHVSWIVRNERNDNGGCGVVERNEAFYALTDAKLSSESTNIGEFAEFLRKESWTEYLKTSSFGYLLNLDDETRTTTSPAAAHEDGCGGEDSLTTTASDLSPERPSSSSVVVVGDSEENAAKKQSSSSLFTENLNVNVDDLTSTANVGGRSSSSTYYSTKSDALRDSANETPTPTSENSSSEYKYTLLQFFSAYLFRETVANADEYVYALPNNDQVKRALKLLDRISSQEAQKVGVLYVGPRQTSEAEILANQCGSARYDRFLAGLGRLISLKNVDEDATFIGGLATDGRDGEFTYVWSDQVTQLVFHVATLMPNKESDKASTEKKRHIGNNHVTIVFNESGLDYKLTTITGQFSYVAIVVEPLDATTMLIKLKAKDEISKWLSLKEAVLSDDKAPLLCRQMTMRAELSARIWYAQSSHDDVYLSRSLERLKQIRHVREKFHGKTVSFDNAFEP